ncbi:MAG: RluA family pseudouridine synthase [Gemmatimonadota bacterium]|nr:RluA family pseudouridine synthase [Gemmatimonadota bacterium]MDH4350609.1 RluA family pseudouridine synthase [Gemmatimonadota bacterium]MDH5197828.1 RluA family pseudouridine synthase [Gemmatimonadota bacterium]
MSEPPRRPTPPNSLPEPPGSVADVRTFSVLTASTERLDRFLADQLALSRTVAARLIAAGAVTVNAESTRASRLLERGDVVTLTLPTAAAPREITPWAVPLVVVHEDDDLLVLDKPAGMVVHPAPGHWDTTLVNALVARGIRLSSGERGRPGIVHRLDRDTSGLLVVAKHDEVHRRLARALGLRRIERHYAALAWGHVPEPRTIDAAIGRHPRDRKRMAVLATGRAARSHVDPIARFGVCDLLRVRLATGRTHQIRVHLAHVGHPVVGDPVYEAGGSRRMTGADQPAARALAAAAPRQALHAARLAFAHPRTREWLEFRSEWPADLQPALAAAAGDEALLARPSPLDYLGFFK